MRTRLRVHGAAIPVLAMAAVLLFAGCTSSDADRTDSSSASTTPTSTAVTTTSPPASSTSAAPSASVTSSGVVSTVSPAPANTWPPDLTPEQIAQAQAAIAAYVGYVKLLDQAYADPGKDWSTEAARWATDPVKSSFLQNVAGTAARGQYATGSIAVYPQVTKVEPGLVTMTVCADATNSGFFDREGNSIKAPDAPGSYFRHPSEVQVAQYEGGSWLVTFITDDYTKTC